MPNRLLYFISALQSRNNLARRNNLRYNVRRQCDRPRTAVGGLDVLHPCQICLYLLSFRTNCIYFDVKFLPFLLKSFAGWHVDTRSGRD